jgi:hypothetical protein
MGQAYEFVRTGDPALPVLVRDRATRMPDVELTLFASTASGTLGLAPATVKIYMYQLAKFSSWTNIDEIARREGWHRHGEPKVVQALVDRYLRQVGGCDLAYKRDRHGPTPPAS